MSKSPYLAVIGMGTYRLGRSAGNRRNLLGPQLTEWVWCVSNVRSRLWLRLFLPL